MLFVWTLGAVAGPLVANLFTAPFGDDALHWVNFAIMLGYVVFLGIRIRFVEPVSSAEQTTHVEIVPTSTEIAPPEKP